MIIAKFFDWLWTWNVITQEPIISAVQIVEDLDGFSYATFSMPVIEWIEEDIIVEIYNVELTDTLLFRWFIYQIKPIREQFWIMDVTLRSEKAIFYRRLTDSDVDFSGWQYVAPAIAAFLSLYNDNYWENWTIDCDVPSTAWYVIHLETAKWDNYYDIFDEIADQVWAKWRVDNWKVIFRIDFFTDRSTWSLYQEASYDWRYPSNANIKWIELIGTAKRANLIIVNDKDWNTHFEDSGYTGVLYWVAFQKLRTGDLEDKALQLLNKLNKLQRTYQVDLEPNAIKADIGDKIKLRVENTNSLYDFTWDVYVTKKTTTIDKWATQIKYDLWLLNTTVENFDSFVNSIVKRVKLLEI